MADFLRRHLYIVSANNRSSVMGSKWPKDKSCVQKIDKPGRSFLLICGDLLCQYPTQKERSRTHETILFYPDRYSCSCTLYFSGRCADSAMEYYNRGQSFSGAKPVWQCGCI